MALRTLSQERARHAYDQVKAAYESFSAGLQQRREGLPAEVSKAEQAKAFEQNLADPARRVPMRIRNAGLGQAIAYLRAKQEAEAVVQALADWLYQRKLIPKADGEQLLVQFKDGSAATLRLLTAEALAYLEWYVRFADAKVTESKHGTSAG